MFLAGIIGSIGLFCPIEKKMYPVFSSLRVAIGVFPKKRFYLVLTTRLYQAKSRYCPTSVGMKKTMTNLVSRPQTDFVGRNL